MTIKVLDEFPQPNRLQTFLRKICGGQDIVATVFITERGDQTVWWCTGVNIANPVDRAACIDGVVVQAKETKK